MKNRGFSLVELVMVIAILGVSAAVVGPGLSAAVGGFDLISARRHDLAQGRAGMDRMVREIRLIPGSAQVISIGATNFQFQYPAGTSITYTLSGGNLLRNSDILVGPVTSLAFSYYDDTGAVTATAANVRSVGISFTIDASGNIANLSLRTRVFLRNTGNSYANYTSP